MNKNTNKKNLFIYIKRKQKLYFFFSFIWANVKEKNSSSLTFWISNKHIEYLQQNKYLWQEH